MTQYLCVLRNDRHDKSSERPSPYTFTKFFLAMSTFQIHSLSNSQIYSTVLFPILAALCITSLWLIYLWPEVRTFDPLRQFCPPLGPQPWHPPICFCSLRHLAFFFFNELIFVKNLRRVFSFSYFLSLFKSIQKARVSFPANHLQWLRSAKQTKCTCNSGLFGILPGCCLPAYSLTH